jgi:putative heme transporter
MPQKRSDRPDFSRRLAAFVSCLGEHRAKSAAGSATSAASGGEAAEDAGKAPADHVPAPPDYPPAVSAPRPPAEAVPWGMRVAAEVGWRLLVLAATIYVLIRVISAVQLVVLSFVAALLITALLQPTVARFKRAGLPRGLATAVTFIGGFIVIGLVGWFVVWQVGENIGTLSTRLQDGVIELKKWLLHSPLHVTEAQIDRITKNLNHAIGTNADQITSAGLQGVTVVIEMLTGTFLAMFSTLFLLYDGQNVWNWVLKLFPPEAREGIAGAGPRAWRTLTHYVRGTVVVAFIDAACIGIGIYLLGVPLAVPLAVVIFLGAFVPLVGAVVTGALAMIVALVTQGPFTMLMVLLVLLAVQQIEGHILQPFILGRAVRVHPLAVVLAVATGTLIGSIGGALVAVPLVAVVNTVVGYLRWHSREVALRRTSGPHGATAIEIAPVERPDEPLAGEG